MFLILGTKRVTWNQLLIWIILNRQERQNSDRRNLPSICSYSFIASWKEALDSKLFKSAATLWIAEWSVTKDEIHLFTLAEDVCCVFKNVFAERVISTLFCLHNNMCQNKQCNLCYNILGRKNKDIWMALWYSLSAK